MALSCEAPVMRLIKMPGKALFPPQCLSDRQIWVDDYEKAVWNRISRDDDARARFAGILRAAVDI